MPLQWMDVSRLSFYTMLLLEEVQIDWFPRFNVPQAEFATALRAYPTVEWYLRHKCPQVNSWLDDVLKHNPQDLPDLRQAELAVLSCFEDLLVYVHDPSIYDAQPFLNWDDDELLSITDFTGKTVIDVGAGTGRLTFAVKDARTIFAVEPVANLRAYIRRKAQDRGLTNIFPVSGLITQIPFPDGFADITMGGHVFGDEPGAEYAELRRVTRPGGWIILCPGNRDIDDDRHQFLLAKGFSWQRFEEPQSAVVRKYWLQVSPD
jgi:SAM-dependent methyltransferase